MQNFIEILAAAIARQEGNKTNNIGSLRDAPWFAGSAPLRSLKGDTAPLSRRKYADGSNLVYVDRGQAAGIFWMPRTRQEGIAGLIHQLALQIAQGQSLKQLLNQYAPSSENQTDVYIKNVMAWTGITNADAPLWEYLELPVPVVPSQTHS